MIAPAPVLCVLRWTDVMGAWKRLFTRHLLPNSKLKHDHAATPL